MKQLNPMNQLWKAHRALSNADRAIIVGLICLAPGFLYIAYRIIMFFVWMQ